MNSNKLLALIKLRGFSMSQFLGMIQMPRSTWSKKIRGLSEFTRSEMTAIIRALNMNTEEVMTIFFDKKFPKRNKEELWKTRKKSLVRARL